jgi:hypothetical protein
MSSEIKSQRTLNAAFYAYNLFMEYFTLFQTVFFLLIKNFNETQQPNMV